MKTLDIVVSGKVQGVFYRQSTVKKALELGLKGNVKNLPTGEVEIVVTGDELKLQALINWCKLGPEKAIVENVQAHEIAPQQFIDFSIIR